MSGLLGIAHFKFHEGKIEEFKRLSGKCRQIVQKHDTGTLRYDIFINAEQSEAIVVEEYVDAQALMDHSTHIGDELSAAIMATASVHGELLGELSDEFRAQLKGSPVQPFAPFLCLD
ncbi:putative quinol monooxygenase [Paeniglutamicibacter antarcticus]|uniref:ABM domain-containing protein n=2 Tax=Paeniglutamicibacter antarcticus TaxID=494023 RepID=A0ABP9TPE6_9MICC